MNRRHSFCRSGPWIMIDSAGKPDPQELLLQTRRMANHNGPVNRRSLPKMGRYALHKILCWCKMPCHLTKWRPHHINRFNSNDTLRNPLPFKPLTMQSNKTGFNRIYHEFLASDWIHKASATQGESTLSLRWKWSSSIVGRGRYPSHRVRLCDAVKDNRNDYMLFKKPNLKNRLARQRELYYYPGQPLRRSCPMTIATLMYK